MENQSKRRQTNDQAFHLVLAKDLDPKNLLHAVVILVSSSSSGHDAELTVPRAIKHLLFVLEIIDELQALLNVVGLELEEIEPATEFSRLGLA